MKKILLIVGITTFFAVSCKKEETKTVETGTDYRDVLTGKYSGEMNVSYENQDTTFYETSENISAEVKKYSDSELTILISNGNSIVDIKTVEIIKEEGYENYYFKTESPKKINNINYIGLTINPLIQNNGIFNFTDLEYGKSLSLKFISQETRSLDFNAITYYDLEEKVEFRFKKK
jgi:hypothetical protein